MFKKLTKMLVRLFTATAVPDDKSRQYTVQGLEKNTVDADAATFVRGQIIFDKGLGNTVRFGEASSFGGHIKITGNNNLVEFGAHTKIRGTLAVGGNNVKLVFGDYTTSVDVYLVAAGRDILIGKWCMLSRKVEIRSNDAHAVIDRETRRTLNLPETVVLGDHVWVCGGAHINKGSHIPPDSIVAAMAFVNRKFEEPGVILAGAPAKVVRKGITWSRKMKKEFTENELDYSLYNERGEMVES